MQILSSLSGLQFSAASAGYAPTNSGDVSAIASAYQVVSATATQLYAGSAYLTSLNSTPVSASRAGNAANASMANSAYYDGTGRLISALPDSAAVSSIASSYVSGKLDTTAQVVTATAGDGTYVTSINGLGISGQGGGGGGGVSVQSASARTMYSAADKSSVTGFSGIDGAGPIVLGLGTVVAHTYNQKMQFGSTGGWGAGVFPSSEDGDQNYKWSTGNILLLSSNLGYGYYKGHQLWLCRGSGSDRHRISFDVNNSAADVMIYQIGHSAVITPSGFSIWGPTTATANRRNIDSAVYDRWNSYSAKQDTLAFAYDAVNQISSINGSALGGMDAGPIYGAETIAGYHNGQALYQTLVSGEFNSNATTTSIGPNPLYSGSPLAWIDVSQSYILYGNTAHILPISWQLGPGRNGSISLLTNTRQCVSYSEDSSPTTCSAILTIKYLKA